MEKILVLRGGALGDFIVTLPALALLRERWPRARIELSGNATAGQLAVARGMLDAVHSQHAARWLELFTDAPLSAGMAEWLAGFDLILSYWPDPNGMLRRRFPLRPGQRVLSASAMPIHAPAAAHYCEPLRELGLEPRSCFHPLAPLPGTASDVRRADATAEGIALHPGSGSPRKNWPAENWQRLIVQLPLPVSLILGEAELGQFDASLAAVPPPGILPTSARGRPDVLINRPLEELVAHLSRCRLFLGHDSGISHLAAACGAPCVLLFGPTDPEMWAPPSPRVRVLRHDSGLGSLPVEDVRHAVEEALAGRR